MNILSRAAAASAVRLPLVPSSGILAAAHLLLPHLEHGERIDAAILRRVMEDAFGTSDAAGTWDWKAAYEACDVTTVLFLRKYGTASSIRCTSAKRTSIGNVAKPNVSGERWNDRRTMHWQKPRRS